MSKLIFVCILRILHGYNNACPDNLYSHQVADTIIQYSTLEEVNPDLVTAIGYYESRFKQYAKSEKGAIGIFQIKRHGAVQLDEDLKLSFHQLADIGRNTRIAIHYMGTLNKKCIGSTTWITIYNTGHGKCRSSEYSRGVNKFLRDGYKWEKEKFETINVGEFVIR
jgi:soluble lytic murein transglycosylase-like protein